MRQDTAREKALDKAKEAGVMDVARSFRASTRRKSPRPRRCHRLFPSWTLPSRRSHGCAQKPVARSRRKAEKAKEKEPHRAVAPVDTYAEITLANIAAVPSLPRCWFGPPDALQDVLKTQNARRLACEKSLGREEVR